MKKILDCEDSFVLREHLGSNNRLGIIFPNATGGHFLYTFYSYNPCQALHTSRINSYGTAHKQSREHFDTYGGFTKREQYHDKPYIDSGKSDFLAHYYHYAETRNLFPEHFLIGIQISPEMILFHVYMMIFKVMASMDINALNELLNDTPEMQQDRWQSFFHHLTSYQYCDSFDLIYTTKELYYDKTINPRVKEYRALNRKYVDEYLDFFAKFQLYFSYEFSDQYNLEREFITKHRDKLDI